MKVRFGVADFGYSALTSAMQFYMLFYYTDVVHIDPGVAGTALLVGKLTWDMVNDVVCGYITDKTKSRWGRRRPWIVGCALPLAGSFWLLFSLPDNMSNVVAFFAIIGTFLLYDTFGTMISTAYYAMTAELTLDYDERTRLVTVRMVFNSVGYIFGAAVTTTLAGLIHSGLGVSLRSAWSTTGLVLGVLSGIAFLVTGLAVTMKPAIEPDPDQTPPLRELFTVFKNRAFVWYGVISAMMSVAFTFVTTMLPYFVIYQIKMEGQMSLIMMAMLVVLALALFPCSKAAERVGKARAYALGDTVASAAMLTAFLLPARPSWLIWAVAAVAGLGFSAQWVCPHSMVPDVIEYDELMTGKRREGVYYGMNSLISKIANALSIMLCGWGLKWSGYVDGQAQSGTALFGIRLMFAIVPILLLLGAVPLLLRYPVDKAGHGQVVAELARRRAAAQEAVTSG
jgi:GPH family glycoside/pentoside/hexuronide:cation symporter